MSNGSRARSMRWGVRVLDYGSNRNIDYRKQRKAIDGILNGVKSDRDIDCGSEREL